MGRTVLLLSLLAYASHAQAGRGSIHSPVSADITVDWTRGLIIASGVAAADFRAPDAAIARKRARREARARVLKALHTYLKTVAPRGRQVNTPPLTDLEQQLIVLDTAYASDGSIRLRAALPVETVRTWFFGRARAPTSQPHIPLVLVVDARHLPHAPVIGIELHLGTLRYRGATVFTTDISYTLTGHRKVVIKAAAYANGVVTLASKDGDLQFRQAVETGAPVAVVLSK